MPEPTAPQLSSFENLGDLLKFLRRRARLSQRDLAIAVGYSESQISRLERNRRAPDVATLAARFAPALHVADEPETLARLLELGALAYDATHGAAAGTPPPAPMPAPQTLLARLAAARPGPKTNLPIQLTNFIGRGQQIEDVLRLLRGTRLLTLTGPGGVGKTRLALQVAAALLERGEALRPELPDGAWLVELAPIAEPALVPRAVAQGLALQDEEGLSIRQALTEHLRDKALLLILDNCEHLLQACAELAEELLRAAPRLQILTTSREALGVVGETSYPVPPLAWPDPEQAPLEALAQSEAVQLFVERARAVRPDFALSGQNAAAVAQICRHLDGIPLAIELAAARIRALAVEQIAARLDDRFALLAGGSRTAPARQQTLRGAIDWSYELLSEAERQLFRQLSVFSGGWTLEAGEQVAAQPQALELLMQLVAKSLVQSVQQPSQETRFSLLETIREYAQEKLAEAGEADATRGRHLAFYLALAEEAEPRLRERGQVGWLKRLDRENDNLRAALAWATRRDQGEAEAAQRLAGALAYFWHIRDYAVEAYRWLEAALDLPLPSTPPGPNAWHAKALLGAGWLARAQDPRLKKERLEQALALYRALADRSGAALALWLLAEQARGQGDYPAAQRQYAEALELWLAAEDDWGVGLCLHFMGHLAESVGDVDKARDLFQRSVDVFRQEGDEWQLLQPLGDLATDAWAHGDTARARAGHEENLAAYAELGNNAGTFSSLNALNLMANALCDFSLARATALAIQNLPGLPRYAASGQVRLGLIDYLQGHLDEAETRLQAGLALFRELNDQNGMAWVPPWLGSIAYRRGDLERARALVDEGLATAGPNGYWLEVAFALLARGDVARAQGQASAAAEYYTRSLRMVVKNHHQPSLAERLEGLAKLALEARQAPRAARLFGAAQALRRRIGTPLPPVAQAEHKRALARLRAQLRPGAFKAAWADGAALSWEQAAAYALEPV